MTECRNLTAEETVWVYRQHLMRDFPRAERKSLANIQKSLREGTYRCVGLYDDGRFCGYAFLVLVQNGGEIHCLLDYFAIIAERRSQGLGGRFLSLLREQLSDVEILLCEAEHPQECKESEREIRQRRVQFYLRSGFADTGVTAEAFGVKFVLLEMQLHGTHPQEYVRESYALLYRSFLSPRRYARFIRI